MDVLPEAVANSLTFSSAYDQGSLTELTTSGAVLPGFDGVQLIDTRSLASSLQVHLDDILSDEAKAQRARDPGTFLFHVEAGITIADLDQLLDHQEATNGNPGQRRFTRRDARRHHLHGNARRRVRQAPC